eukprot:8749781-Alexandrium_andersonii.AAC.1
MSRVAADERHVAILEAVEALEEGVEDDELSARPGGATGPPGGPSSGRRTYAGADVVPVEGVAGVEEGLTPQKPCGEVLCCSLSSWCALYCPMPPNSECPRHPLIAESLYARSRKLETMPDPGGRNSPACFRGMQPGARKRRLGAPK